MNFFRRLSLQSKLFSVLLAVSMLSLSVAGIVGFVSGEQALNQTITNQLKELRSNRERAIERYFDYLRDQTISMAKDPTVVESMDAFRDSYIELESAPIASAWVSDLYLFYQNQFLPLLKQNIEGEPTISRYFPKRAVTRYLQYYYLAKNPYGIGRTEQYDFARDGSAYSDIHRRYHPFLRDLDERFAFSNLYLLDSDNGDMIYSVRKTPAFGHNLPDGPFGTPGAKDFFSKVSQGEKGSFQITDFFPSPADYGQPSAYIGSPIFSKSERIGCLVIEVPYDEINRIMTDDNEWEENGLGRTGEALIIGGDNLLRSQSRFLVEDPETYFADLSSTGIPDSIIERIKQDNNPILLQPVNSPIVLEALNGESGELQARDYRGQRTLISFGPINILDRLTWALIAKMDVQEATGSIRIFTRRIVTAAALFIPLIAVISLVVSRRLIQPIYTLIEGTKKMTKGESVQEVEIASQDEFHQLATAFNRMTRALRHQQNDLQSQVHYNESLLQKMMPHPVALRRQEGEEQTADIFSSVTVIAAQLLGVEHIFDTLSPEDAIALLKSLELAMCDAAERHEVEVINSDGLTFLGASGLFTPRLCRDKCVIDWALDSQRILAQFNTEKRLSEPLNLAVGIETGTDVGGLVGRSQLTYNLVGKSAHVARILALQVKNIGGGIAVTDAVYETLQDLYQFALLESSETSIVSGPFWLVKQSSLGRTA
ncbi:MAG: adenylate/guanylate cyclase domain-containing protein [Cyanobacteria bacterium P01_H01_bin.15]